MQNQFKVASHGTYLMLNQLSTVDSLSLLCCFLKSFSCSHHHNPQKILHPALPPFYYKYFFFLLSSPSGAIDRHQV